MGSRPVLPGHRPADTRPMNGVAPNPQAPDKVAEIKRLVELGQYRVDTRAVADAMLRHAERDLEAEGPRGGGPGAQNRCSNPVRSRSASVKTTSAGPSTTAPTQVKPALVLGQAA